MLIEKVTVVQAAKLVVAAAVEVCGVQADDREGAEVEGSESMYKW
jgi:hypothetical protein